MPDAPSRPAGHPAAVPHVGTPHPRGGPACSTASRALAEDLSATASLGRRWLLVEVAGAWGWNVWTSSPVLDTAVGRALARRAQDAGMRIAAIRRPGRARGGPRWRWAIVEAGGAVPGGATPTTPPSITWGEVDDAADLLEVPLDGSTGTPSDDPVFVVCAHGRHDECCAVRGRTAAADLAEAYPDETWECSHIGGDRFAGTMLLFPHALGYGRIDEHDVVAIADAYRAGRIVPEAYRGRTAFTHVEQAAQAAAVREFGDTSVDAYRPLGVEDQGDEWLVTLDDPDGAVVVRLRRDVSGPVYTTCRATVPVEILRYAVVDVRRGPPPAR